MMPSAKQQRFRWTLLLFVVAAGTSAVVAAAIWGRMPWEQVPLLVLTLWLGIILPWVLQWSWSHPPRRRRWRGSGRRGPHHKDQIVLSWDASGSRWQSTVDYGLALAGLLLGLDLWSSPPVVPDLEVLFEDGTHRVYAVILIVFALVQTALVVGGGFSTGIGRSCALTLTDSRSSLVGPGSPCPGEW
jgi:energy-coupling factor transporter transmembrane protein EcfT